MMIIFYYYAKNTNFLGEDGQSQGGQLYPLLLWKVYKYLYAEVSKTPP